MLKILTRWLLAAALWAWMIRSLMKTGVREDYGAAYPILLGMGTLVASVILISPELVEVASRVPRRFLASIFYPDEKVPPPLDYTLARLYFREWRYSEALKQYRLILGYYPHELPAYLEGMEAAFLAGSPTIAKRLYRKGRRRLKNGDNRKQLEAMWESLQK